MRSLLAAFSFFVIFSASAISQPELAEVIKAAESAAKQSANSQEKISAADERASDLLQKFRRENRRIEDLRLYNRQLEIRIKDQLALIENLKKFKGGAGELEKQIPALLLRMTESLEQFVALDIPFLPEERAKRIDSLKRLMARGDVSIAEQFRRVFDAYFEEIQYGNTIGAYEGTVDFKGEKRRVTFLRVGRTALLYQTADLSSAMWDAQENRWISLGSEYKDSIRRGVAIAREQAAPNLIFVPVRAPAKGEN